MKKIYKIINTVNNKIYIGKTTKSLENRFNEHLYEAKRYKQCILENKSFGYKSKLYAAMLKYGVNNFKIELIAEFADDINLELQEIDYIKKFDSCNTNIGYNISPGGLGGPLFKGHRHSDNMKKLASLRTKGISQNKEFVEKRIQKHRKKYQNLTTGEIFKGMAAAKQAYGGTICYAIKYNGKANGNFWVTLDDSHQDGYHEAERKAIIAAREKDLHERRSNAVLRGKHNQSEETKKRAAEKRILKFKDTIANRTKEEKLTISKNLSESRKGKKHSLYAIQKLKDYYKNASPEMLTLRNKHNGDGQRGKKRYENIYTGKHKMFIPGQEPKDWILVVSKEKPRGKRKFKNKITGENKMFFPENVDIDLWERVIKYDRKSNKEN